MEVAKLARSRFDKINKNMNETHQLMDRGPWTVFTALHFLRNL